MFYILQLLHEEIAESNKDINTNERSTQLPLLEVPWPIRMITAAYLLCTKKWRSTFKGARRIYFLNILQYLQHLCVTALHSWEDRI